MSSRPANPTYSTLVFAPDTNYPVGANPWNGTPTKVAWSGAASVGFVPKGAVPTQAINYAINHLADREAQGKSLLNDLVNWTGQGPALNIVVTKTGMGDIRDVFDDGKGGVWACGNAANVASSYDRGLSWNTGLATAVASAEDCYTGAIDPLTGNVVVATLTRYVFNSVAGTMAKVDVASSAVTLSAPAVVWEPTNSKFVWLDMSGSLTLCKSSSTGAVWATKTTPSGSGWGSLDASLRMVAKPGRIVAACKSTTIHQTHMAYSDDAGVTWTTSNVVDTMGTAGGSINLAYLADQNLFLLSIGEATDNVGELWQSTDGATWTKIRGFTSGWLTKVAALGTLWVSTFESASGTPQVVYSVDAGVTWTRTGVELSTNTSATDKPKVIAVAGGFVFSSIGLSSVGKIFFTSRAGLVTELGTVT